MIQNGAFVHYGTNDDGSVKVRAIGEYPDYYLGQPNEGWSECLSFHTANLDEMEDEYCGDRTAQSFEECDDGNRTNGDGCDSGCFTEHSVSVTSCNQTVHSGREGFHQTFQVELGGSSGGFWVAWDTATIPDQITVKYEGAHLYQTGCVGTQDIACSGEGCGGARWIDLPASNSGSTQIQVIVDAHCDSSWSGDTIWSFLVECPASQQGSSANAGGDDAPEPEQARAITPCARAASR